MFLNAPAKPTPLKKTVYLIASAILGLLLGFIVYALLGIEYLHWFVRQGGIGSYSSVSAVLLFLEILFMAIGFVGGFFLGKFWWRKVYVERAWAWRKRK